MAATWRTWYRNVAGLSSGAENLGLPSLSRVLGVRILRGEIMPLEDYPKNPCWIACSWRREKEGVQGHMSAEFAVWVVNVVINLVGLWLALRY